MLLFQIKRPNTLFQSQQRLVNLCTIKPCLFILINGVCSTFTACQVYKAHFPKRFLISRPLQLQLQNGMRPRTVSVGSSYTTCSWLESIANNLHDLFDISNWDFWETHNVYHLLMVFSTMEDLPIVEQVIQFATVNFIKGDIECQFRIALQKVAYIIRCKQI